MSYLQGMCYMSYLQGMCYMSYLQGMCYMSYLQGMCYMSYLQGMCYMSYLQGICSYMIFKEALNTDLLIIILMWEIFLLKKIPSNWQDWSQILGTSSRHLQHWAIEVPRIA